MTDTEPGAQLVGCVLEPDPVLARVSPVGAADPDLEAFYASAYPRVVGLVAALAGGTEDAEAIAGRVRAAAAEVVAHQSL